MPKHTDIPTENDLRQLMSIRTPPCVSIYLPTSPLPTEADANRIEFKTLASDAMARIGDDIDKRQQHALQEALAHLDHDESFWTLVPDDGDEVEEDKTENI